MTRLRSSFVLSAWSVLLGGALMAGAPPGPPGPRGQASSRVALESTETFAIASRFSEQTYRIDVALPYGYGDSEADYPVLYLLDSDVLFGVVSDLTRLMPLEEIFLGAKRLPQLVVVGVGYPGGVAEMSERRGWDFGTYDRAKPAGSMKFSQFVTRQLIPTIDSRFRTRTGDRTLVGASRAGIFVLNTLLWNTTAFRRYIALSPVIEPAIFEVEQEPAWTGSDSLVRLFLSAGSEGEIEAGIAQGVGRLAEVLEESGHPGLGLETRFYPGESHVSVLPQALVDGLVAVFGAARPGG